MKLEAFIAESVCGKTCSEPFPIVRESSATIVELYRTDFYLKDREKGCLTIVRAVNEHAALVAVAEAANGLFKTIERLASDNAKIEDPYGTCYTATQASGLKAKAMLNMREALANLANVRGAK